MAVEVWGKISMSLKDDNENSATEVLGYTKANVFSDTVAAEALNAFARGVCGLTTGTYQSSKVTYEVDLDEAAEG